jgi:hypothetical protein
MRFDHRHSLLDNLRHAEVPDEQNQGAFGVPPGQVTEQLIDGLGHHLGAVPDFALGHEDVGVAGTDQRGHRQHRHGSGAQRVDSVLCWSSALFALSQSTPVASV